MGNTLLPKTFNPKPSIGVEFKWYSLRVDFLKPMFISVGRFLVRISPWSNFQPLDGAIFLWVYITKPFHCVWECPAAVGVDKKCELKVWGSYYPVIWG